MNFSIRFAMPEDCPTILRFIRALAAYENLETEVRATEESLCQFLFEAKQAEVLIGEEEGTPVAFALFFHNYSTFLGRAGLYLEDLFVREESRGKGYGKAMLAQLAAIAAARGCTRLDWCCLAWNHPSIRFYQGLGATLLEDWRVFRLGGDALTSLAKIGPQASQREDVP